MSTRHLAKLQDNWKGIPREPARKEEQELRSCSCPCVFVLTDSLTLDIVLLLNATQSGVQHEAIWLTTQTEKWLSQQRVATLFLSSTGAFEYLGAAAANSSNCADRLSLSRWQVTLRVNSSLFESELRRLVQTSLSHDSTRRVLRLCVRSAVALQPHYRLNELHAAVYCNDDLPTSFALLADSLCRQTTSDDADDDEFAEENSGAEFTTASFLFSSVSTELDGDTDKYVSDSLIISAHLRNFVLLSYTYICFFPFILTRN